MSSNDEILVQILNEVKQLKQEQNEIKQKVNDYLNLHHQKRESKPYLVMLRLSSNNI